MSTRVLDEARLWQFSKDGDVTQILSLLSSKPGLDVNWASQNDQWTALHRASKSGHATVVELLLAHPHIAVNVTNKKRQTPFALACACGSVQVVRVFLKDPQVNVLLEDGYGCTPLWAAADNCAIEVIEWLIASGRDLGDVSVKKGKLGTTEFTALDIAKAKKFTEVATLLEKFIATPTFLRQQIRRKLNFAGSCSSFSPLKIRSFYFTVLSLLLLLQKPPLRNSLALEISLCALSPLPKPSQIPLR